MNTKTLLVLCCLLAAAQARPAAAPAGCSLSCSGRNFWSGYTTGTTSQYTFEQKVEMTSGLNEQKSVLVQVTGKANVEVHSDCEMVLTVDAVNPKSSKSPTEAANLDTKELPKATLEALKAPLRFSFEDGRIRSVCPAESETRASLNFKRGLLSQLQLSIDKPEQEVSAREDDVLGNCWTTYKNLGSNKVEKTKDLSSCTNNFEVFPRQGVKFEAPALDTKWPTVVQGELKCTIELDSASQVIKETKCEENRVMENNLGEKGLGEVVKATTSLKLDQTVSSLASALAEIKDRSDLSHKHKTGAKCHDSKAWLEEDIFNTGNECLEKKLPEAGAGSAEFKARAKKTIDELCEETKSNNMYNTSAAKYADLIKYLRGITSQEDFTGLFDWVKGGYCSDNSMLKVIVYSAIPSVGTRQSVQVILNQLKDSDGMSTDANTASWLTNGVALIPQPTPEIIRDVLQFTKKSKEDTLVIVSKDAPLALSAITGRYCSMNPNCETNEVVAEVLTFFSEALGTNCSNLEAKEEVPPGMEYDYAFAALLSVGNIGRAAGGAASIIACAENAKLSVAHRTFALRSLRRFPDLATSEKMRLGLLIKSKSLDSELRITAYQAVVRYATISFFSDERVINTLSELMQDQSEDQQVQRYIFAHLSLWLAKQRRSTDSFTLANILREYEKIVTLSKLSGMQVSNHWARKFKNPSTKSKAELESNIIYSSKSIMPRFVNFNFTVESPLSGEAINMFEFGMRMEGMEGILEQLFNALSKEENTDDDELIRKRRQASPVMKDEQKLYKQTPPKQRFDFYTRKNGMELMHNNLDETILGVVPQFMKTLDFENVKGLAGEKISSLNLNTAGQAAGTFMESTISVSTITGFPITIKKEMHYLTNIGLKQSFDMPSSTEAKLEFEVQPSVSVYMARTVTVDSAFERTGLKSQTSGLSSMGVKLSMEANFGDMKNILFSYKMDPVKKQQKILELKTDVLFVQHNGPKNVIENPVVTTSELTPVNIKCFTPATVKLFGRRMCLETNFERTYNPTEFVRQNPGSFRLYIDKGESFGVFEATLKFKIDDDKNFEFLAVLGDQKSADRHAKIQFSLNNSPGSRKIVLDLANPVLPVRWASESKRSGDGDDITVGLKFGSTDYGFKGKRVRDASIKAWKLDGDFFRKDKERQKLSITTKYAFNGFLKYLPLFRFDVTAATPSNDKLTFNHLIDKSGGKFEISLLGSHEKSGSVVTSVKSRLQFNKMQRDASSQTRTLLYDTEVTNKNGPNFVHTFSAKIDRKRAAEPDTWDSTVAVDHKFKHGVNKEISVVDMDANLKMKVTMKPGKFYDAIGSGSMNYDSESGRKTAKLTNLRLVVGEKDVIDSHEGTKTFLGEYTVELEGSQNQALVAVQLLPLYKWRIDNQCAYFALKATKNAGIGAEKTYEFRLSHTSTKDAKFELPKISQVARIVYGSQVLLDGKHEFYATSFSGENVVRFSFGHYLNVQTYDRTCNISSSYSAEMGQVTTLRVTTTAITNGERKIKVNQTLTLNPSVRRVEYGLNYERPATAGSFRIYSKDSGFDERRRSAQKIFNYLRNARKDGFKFKTFSGLVKEFVSNIKVESGLEITGPSMSMKATNYIDMTTTNGVLMSFNRTFKSGDMSLTRSVKIFKELEMTSSRYRRMYKINVEYDTWASLLVSEVVYKKSSNPELQISLSKTSVSGPQGPNFSLTATGQLIRNYKRDDQVALHVNVTRQYGDMERNSKLKVVVDTAPWKYLNPALNVSLEVTSNAAWDSFTVAYDAGVMKSELSQKINPKKIVSLTSELQVRSYMFVGSQTLWTYNGITKFSALPGKGFEFAFIKKLDSMDIISVQTALNSEGLLLEVKSSYLPLKEVSYKANYADGTDGFKDYLSKFRLSAMNYDILVQDKGKLKLTGRSGAALFSTVYEGALTVSGIPQVQFDKLEYSGVLEAKTTGEFNNYFEIAQVTGETSENVLLITNKLNYWPFEISGQLKTPFYGIDHYGFNISVGQGSQANSHTLRFWLASPQKQTTLTYQRTYTKAEKLEVTSQGMFTSDHLFSQKSDKIESSLSLNANSLFDYTFALKITTPFKKVQAMQWDIITNQQKQAVTFTLKRNDKEDKVANFERNVRTQADGTKLVNAVFAIKSIKPEVTGFETFVYTGDVVLGNDYLWAIDLSVDNKKLASLNALWLKSGSTYPQLSRFSVPGANFGLDVTGYIQGAPTFQFYLLRSGNEAKSQWQMKYKGEVEVQTSVEFTNGRLTSGTGTAMGKSITFSSPSDGVIEVTATSSASKNSITWTSKIAGSMLQTLTMKFSIDGKESCVSYAKEGEKITATYGSCSTPNSLEVVYKFSDFWTITKSKVMISVQHKTVPASNDNFYLLPGVTMPLIISSWPFKFDVDVNNELKIGKWKFDSSATTFKFSQEYDLGKFPRAMTFKRTSSMNFGSRQIDQTFQVNYDWDARTVDVKIETSDVYKITVTNTGFSIEVTNVFTTGVAYITEASTEKKMIEITFELKPESGSQPCTLRLWKNKIDNGWRFALEFVQHTSKDVSLVSDVTNFKYTNEEFKMDIATTFSSTLIERFRSANSVIGISFIRDTEIYTLNYKESFTTGGEVLYELESVFKGRRWSFPSTVRMAFVRGYLESELSYDFNPPAGGQSYILASLSKFGDNRDSYLFNYRTKPGSEQAGKYWRDSSLEFSSPRRQVYLSKEFKVLESGALETELQVYINKRNSEGIKIVLGKDFTQANVYKRTLRAILPTRKVGYDRVMKIDGIKLGYDITVYWDMETAVEKKITINFKSEKERRPNGYYYYHTLEATSPFLKKKISKELFYERKENEFKISLSHAQESDDKVSLVITGARSWDSWRSAYQKELNISFKQQKGDVKADMRITFESSKLVGPQRVHSRSKYLRVYNIYTTVPTLSIDSHIRIRHILFEEFSYACNQGATFSLRFFKGHKRSRMILFVSDSKKKAGQLTMIRDRLMSTWEATLDTGKGYMDPKSALSFPIYEPSTVLVKASAGLSASGRKIHFGVVNGDMNVKNNIRLWKPETVPRGLDFFFVGIRLSEQENTMSYASHWRIRREMNSSPYTKLKEVLIDPWAKVESIPVGTDMINKLLKSVAESRSANIDTDAVLSMLTSISSNDIDSLKRWAAKARANNEFLADTIGRFLADGFYLAKAAAERWAEYVKSRPYTDALPSDLGILSGISKLADAAASALNRVPISDVWRNALTMMRYAGDQFAAYFSAYVNRLDAKIKDRISTLTGGTGTSILDMVFNAVSSVYPVERVLQKVTIIVQVYATGLWTAHTELVTQVGTALQPFFISTLGEIPKVYDFIDNLFYEISQWSVYFSSLIQAVIKDNAAKIERSIPGQSAFSKNVLASVGLFLIGDYSGAIRQYFNTDANVINVWRVTCDKACLDSGSFAAINGTLYLPVDLSRILSERAAYVRSLIWADPPTRLMRAKAKRTGSQRFSDAVEELRSERGFGGVFRRLVSPKHRTAEVTGDLIKTFGGTELKNLSPCRYLLAHDFLSNDFSVYQTYTWDGGMRKRGDLLIRFFNVKAVISSTNELKLNDATVSPPVTSKFGEQSVSAKARSGILSVKFHSELKSVLEVKCNRVRNTCSVRVHPLYHGRMNGAFGSNDGHPGNDLHGGSASEHMRLWVADSCVMS